jgi:site-specific DNA-methyltransferase (adenine-specific)
MGMSGGAQSKGDGYDKGQGIGLNRVIERKNTHPTVKPQELMKYLCRLVTPKGGVVLDPFMGSGSTGMAAKDEGFDFIGIEKEQEYFEIAEARIKVSSPLMEFM